MSPIVTWLSQIHDYVLSQNFSYKLALFGVWYPLGITGFVYAIRKTSRWMRALVVGLFIIFLIFPLAVAFAPASPPDAPPISETGSATVVRTFIPSDLYSDEGEETKESSLKLHCLDRSLRSERQDAYACLVHSTWGPYMDPCFHFTEGQVICAQPWASPNGDGKIGGVYEVAAVESLSEVLASFEPVAPDQAKEKIFPWYIILDYKDQNGESYRCERFQVSDIHRYHAPSYTCFTQPPFMIVGAGSGFVARGELLVLPRKDSHYTEAINLNKEGKEWTVDFLPPGQSFSESVYVLEAWF